MTYNFDQTVDRKGLNAIKYVEVEEYYGDKDIIPMWVADMDLITAQPIVDAVKNRAERGAFGYTSRPSSYTDAICAWHKKRNNWDIDKSLMSNCVGVVHAINAIISEFTNPCDKMLFFTPVYPQFFRCVEQWNREIITSKLIEKETGYEIDFNDYEEKLQQGPKLLILCSPHNPVGRVWTKDELKKIGDLAIKYNVKIISDEIHAGLTFNDVDFQPMATVSSEIAKNTIVCTSFTKTFNLAGLQTSSVIFSNHEDKDKFDNFWSKCGVDESNCFASVAVEAATKCEDWLEQALDYIKGNVLFLKEFLSDNIPEITFIMPQATYLVWLDCRELGLSQQDLEKFMVEEAKILMNSGTAFSEDSVGFMRINIACTRATVEKAANQLLNAVNKIKK